MGDDPIRFGGWPRATPLEGGGFGVRGRIATARRWRVLSGLFRGALMLVSLVLLAAAALPLVASIFEDARWPWWADRGLYELIRLRNGMAWIMTERCPEIGRALHYDPRAFIDWHLAGAALMLSVPRRPLGDLLALLFGCIIPPLLHRHLRVDITADRVRVSGPLGGRRFRRNPTEALVFRANRIQAHVLQPAKPTRSAAFFPEMRQQPAHVELLCGRGRRRLVYALRADEAEAFVARCNDVLARTTQLIPSNIL